MIENTECQIMPAGWCHCLNICFKCLVHQLQLSVLCHRSHFSHATLKFFVLFVQSQIPPVNRYIYIIELHIGLIHGFRQKGAGAGSIGPLDPPMSYTRKDRHEWSVWSSKLRSLQNVRGVNWRTAYLCSIHSLHDQHWLLWIRYIMNVCLLLMDWLQLHVNRWVL